MPVRLTAANPLVEENRGRACVERGPLVYCLEEADHPAAAKEVHLRDLRLSTGGTFVPVQREIAGRSLTALAGTMYSVDNPAGDGLYGELTDCRKQPLKVSLIPYFAWNNREPMEDREMCVFFPVNYE